MCIRQKKRNMEYYKNFGEIEVQFFKIDSKFWFVGKEITKLLGFRDDKIIEKFVPPKHKCELKKIRQTCCFGSEYPANELLIDDIGILCLTMKTNQVDSKEFQDWVVDEMNSRRCLEQYEDKFELKMSKKDAKASKSAMEEMKKKLDINEMKLSLLTTEMESLKKQLENSKEKKMIQKENFLEQIQNKDEQIKMLIEKFMPNTN